MTGDDSIARVLLVLHAEVEAAMFLEAVELFEGPVVEQEFDALARGHLAGGVLAFDALRASAGKCSGVLLGKLL